VRVIGDHIELRIRALLDHRIDAIRTDRTADQLRLAHLLPGLVERFPELADEQVRTVADAVLCDYAEARAFRADRLHRLIPRETAPLDGALSPSRRR
jgi:hypothetical protein